MWWPGWIAVCADRRLVHRACPNSQPSDGCRPGTCPGAVGRLLATRGQDALTSHCGRDAVHPRPAPESIDPTQVTYAGADDGELTGVDRFSIAIISMLSRPDR